MTTCHVNADGHRIVNGHCLYCSEPMTAPAPLSPERLAEIKDLLRYESSIAFYSSRAKESLLLLVADDERLRARVDEVERRYIFDTAELKKRIAELEAAAPHRFEAEFQGVSDAKRRLANCKHCHGARTDARHTEGGLS